MMVFAVNGNVEAACVGTGHAGLEIVDSMQSMQSYIYSTVRTRGARASSATRTCCCSRIQSRCTGGVASFIASL